MQVSWKTVGIASVVALLCGVLIGARLSCGATPPQPVVSQPVRQSSETDTVVKFLPGRMRLIHDSLPGLFDTVFFQRVDTLSITKVETHRDTCYLSKPHVPLFDSAFAAFLPSTHDRNLMEVWVGAEHDFAFGGYGAQAQLKLNLDHIGVSNIVPFAQVGYLHGPNVTVGIEGKVWGLW